MRRLLSNLLAIAVLAALIPRLARPLPGGAPRGETLH